MSTLKEIEIKTHVLEKYDQYAQIVVEHANELPFCENICDIFKIACINDDVATTSKLMHIIDMKTTQHLQETLNLCLKCAIELDHFSIIIALLTCMNDYTNYFFLVSEELAHEMIIMSCNNKNPRCYELLTQIFGISAKSIPENYILQSKI